MAWRFKVSKYKNASPKFPKREETILDVSVGTLMQSCGNHIAASCTYMAFNTDVGGVGNLGILPLETTGRIGQSLPTLKCHTDYVTDMAFSPFHDELLATCSADCTVRVWSLSEPERLSEHLTCISQNVPLPALEQRVENLCWNTVADNILAASVYKSVKVYDLTAGKEMYDISDHGDQIQSICWHGNGNTLVTSCKDKKLRVMDPRSCTVTQEVQCFDSNRDSRAIWIGSTDYLLTTGFTSSRDRTCALWDSRSLSSSVSSESFGNSTGNCYHLKFAATIMKAHFDGVLMPLLDEDTCMLFLIGKGDSAWSYLEISTTEKKLTSNSVERMEKSEQIKGACLIPKRGVNVMDGEVDRLLIVTQNSVIPIPYIVPRKQYKDFHADLFPDTKCGEAALTSSQWITGENGQVSLMSLDPDNRSKQRTMKVQGKSEINLLTKPAETEPKKVEAVSHPTSTIKKNQASETKNKDVTPEQKVAISQPKEPSRTAKKFAALHQSKCKYLHGKTLHNSTHITNIRKLDRTLPGQSDLFYANAERCAIPLEGSGGLVAILELNKPGRLPDTGVPVLQCGSKVNDMAFDPFDNRRILIGSDSAKVFIWQIPEGGVTETLSEEYESYLLSHTEKIYFIRFHPLAKDVVMTCAYDMRIKLWNLNGNTEESEIRDHTDEIFCAEWSPDGKYIATVCKDGKVRIFDPRTSDAAIKTGIGPEGSRGARVVWTNKMKYLCVSGFNRASVRILSIYSVTDLGDPLNTAELNVVPSILIPHYDEGTSTLFLTGRGDNTIFTFEVSDEPPHLFPFASISLEGVHQGISLLPKTACNVRQVEIAKLWRLTQNSVEPVSVTVPRVKTEYFQDDLFPDTVKPGVPALSASEWFRGVDKPPVKISLKPADMKPLSEAPVEAPKVKKYDSYNPETYKSDDMKKEELISAVTNKLDIKDDPLPQDEAEGVDSDEWEAY